MADGSPSGIYRLPTLVPGVGERRACQHDSGCLERLVRVHWTASAAHCEPGCQRHEAAPRWAAVAHAHAYGGPSALAEAAAIDGDTPEGEPLPRHGRRAVGR